MISTLQSCWYQLYGRAAEGVDQKVRVGDWSLKGTGNLVHFHPKNSHCDDVALFILGSFCYILGTCCPWWVSVENWRAGAEPEVCVCGSCVQHPREHVGQQRRSQNIANSSICANTTGLNMGAHGTGTLCSHEEHKMLQLESFFCFNKPFSVLSVVNIMMFFSTGGLPNRTVCFGKESLQDAMEPFYLPWQWIPKESRQTCHCHRVRKEVHYKSGTLLMYWPPSPYTCLHSEGYIPRSCSTALCTSAGVSLLPSLLRQK